MTNGDSGGTPTLVSLYKAAEKLWCRPVTLTDMQFLNGLVELGLKHGVIVFLLEYCLKKGKTSPPYMRTVADEWLKNGVVSEDGAKAECAFFDACFEILRAARAQKLTDTRRASFRKWLYDWNIPLDEIKAAAENTVNNTKNEVFSLSYCEKILLTKKDGGGEGLGEKPAAAPAHAAPRRNRFANFEERGDTDFDALERKERERLMKLYKEREGLS